MYSLIMQYCQKITFKILLKESMALDLTYKFYLICKSQLKFTELVVLLYNGFWLK